MRSARLLAASSIALASAVLADSRVVITEIMYNPASAERRGETEWVEIANLGDTPVQLDQWRLDDEDQQGGADWSDFSCELAPRGVAVLVNKAAVDEATFREAWDPAASPGSSRPGYQVIPVMWGNLANSASADNEILTLLDNTDQIICRVNFENGGDWPRCTGAGGPSIYLADLAADDLSEPAHWQRSVDGEAGAQTSRRAGPFGTGDIGSPGRLPAADAQPPAASPTPPAASSPPPEHEDTTDDIPY